MAAGVWTIDELDRRDGPPASFKWSADTTPPSSNGGARAAPRVPWTFGGVQRNVRTNYPGARKPSFQVLGPAKKPFSLEGTFDDRFNFAGYAEEEMRRLEEMVERGNPCRVAFQNQVFIGLFVDYDFPYRRAWQIGYVLQFEVAEREDQPSDASQTDIEMSPATAFDAVDLAVQAALDLHDGAPKALLAGTATPDVELELARMTSSVDQLGATLNNRELVPPESPVDGFTRLATQFRDVQGAAYGLLVTLGSMRSDTELAVQTAMAVLDFETWSRSMRFAARIAMGHSVAGDRSCSARSEPDAKRLYRPYEGESLYSISRLFYGTPHAWRLIFDRNHLSSVTLTGEEILIIPERG